MSSTRPTDDGFNHTQEIELQKHNQSFKFKCASTVTKLEDGQNNCSSADEHQVIDLPDATPYPFVLAFFNLSYNVKSTRQKTPLPFFQNNTDEIGSKVLLDNISGQAREGEIMAVLGASGSGKSTLIDALAGRIEKESLNGTVTLNGEVLQSRFLKVISAYVMQDDLLFPMLTVEETLMFSAEFTLPRTISKQMKQARVQALIDQLGLRNAAKTAIGDEGHRGISGGERRRVSIGIDIIHDPILLFLDEPTTGLDSTSAFMVVQVLQRIAKSGSIVILSIHQPSYRIVSLLNYLIFLSHGKTVYCGKPSSLLQFFKEFGHSVPENENPTEFALDLIREFEETPSRIINLVEFNKCWHTMKNPNELSCHKPTISVKEAIKASISKGKLVVAAGNEASNDPNPTSSVPTFANPFWIETIVICKRQLTNSRRMPLLFGIRFVSTLAVAFILSSLYWQLDASPKGIQRRSGFVAFVITFVFFNCVEEIPVFIQERYIFMRETAYNTYRRSSYVLAHSIVSIPSLMFLSFTLAITTFWAVGLAGGFSGFFFFFITIFASYWAGGSFMTLVSGLVSHYLVALCIGAALLAFFLLFSGFFITGDQYPPYWIWFHYMSLIKYPYQGVLQNEYGDPNKCFTRGVQVFDDTPLDDVSESMKVKLLETMSSLLGANVSSSSCLMNGTKIIERNGATDISKWYCFWITIAWGLFFRVLFYFALLFGSKSKRR